MNIRYKGKRLRVMMSALELLVAIPQMTTKTWNILTV